MGKRKRRAEQAWNVPKVKCPVCGGSKELNLYVSATHPILLALTPTALALSLSADGYTISVDKDKKRIAIKPGKYGNSFSRHMAMVCLAFEGSVPDSGLLAAAKDSNHPWSVVLRAARVATETSGEANASKLISAGVVDQLVRLHRSCPVDGPSKQSPSIDWCKCNRWERCTDLNRDSGTERYNGLDFLSMEVLMRLAGVGNRI
jgi:hypothetical protein